MRVRWPGATGETGGDSEDLVWALYDGGDSHRPAEPDPSPETINVDRRDVRGRCLWTSRSGVTAGRRAGNKSRCVPFDRVSTVGGVRGVEALWERTRGGDGTRREGVGTERAPTPLGVGEREVSTHWV